MSTVVQTDQRSRLVLPGHSNERFIVHELEDGSILLEPARVISQAQYEYDTNPELQDLLSKALTSPTVKHTFTRRSE